MKIQRILPHLLAVGMAVQLSIAPVVAADLAKAAPATAGFSSEGLDRIEGALKPYLADGQLAGAVVGIARQGKLVYLKSFGAADAEAGKPMSDDAIFRIASMTKAVTSVAGDDAAGRGQAAHQGPGVEVPPRVQGPASDGDARSERR